MKDKIRRSIDFRDKFSAQIKNFKRSFLIIAISALVFVPQLTAASTLTLTLNSTMDGESLLVYEITSAVLIDTMGDTQATAIILDNTTAQFDLNYTIPGDYFIELNNISSNRIPTRIDSNESDINQSAGRKMQNSIIGSISDPTYIIKSRTGSNHPIVNYMTGENEVGYSFIIVSNNTQKSEIREINTSRELSNFSAAGDHPTGDLFKTWILGPENHGIEYNGTDSNCSGCHGDLNTKISDFFAITSNEGFCYRCHYGKGGDDEGFVDPIQITADDIAPVTNIIGVTEGDSFNNSVTIELNATDNEGGSGVNETFYMRNGGPTTTYSAPFTVDTEGQNNVTYWSTDNAGNVESQNMVNFTITNISVEDSIAPVTEIIGVTEGDSFNNSVTVELNATDNEGGSGVNETFYMRNGGPTTTYSAPFTVDTEGQNNVTYWSTDNAGNVESQNMVNFTITNISVEDSIAPVTEIIGVTEGDSFNDSVTVELNATDNEGGSGVNETFYMRNGGPTTTYSAPFTVDTEGQNIITYWSTDNAGNVESQNMVNFTIVSIPAVNETAMRIIESKTILPGESTNVTVEINGISNALSLQEIPPEGWTLTRGSDDAVSFKNSTNEWVWMSILGAKTVTYTLTAPMNISIGTYMIEGTISDANGILTNVGGDNSIKIDILESYRRLGDDPDVMETRDLLTAFDDFMNNRIPVGFDRPLNQQEIDELINEWINS